MGSKQRYLANAGAVDVAHLIRAFEEVNECVLTVTLSVVERASTSDLHILCLAHTRSAAGVDPVLLGSLDFYRSQNNFLTLDSVIIYALYQMDARLESARGYHATIE